MYKQKLGYRIWSTSVVCEVLCMKNYSMTIRKKYIYRHLFAFFLHVMPTQLRFPVHPLDSQAIQRTIQNHKCVLYARGMKSHRI